MTVHVVGLDGADPLLLREWVDEGALSAFERVVEQGIFGELESTLPPVTFPAWKCYSTGKSPGKLGVYEWYSYERETNAIEANDSSDFCSLEYWDVLAERGYTPAVVNMPTTHPPNTADGVLTVAGSPASERGAFTEPASLKEELLAEIPDYRVKPALVLDEATPEELVAEANALVDLRFDAAEWLADRSDLVHITVFVTDTVQHRLWDQPSRLLELYERIDARLSKLLNDAETVFLLSDHGFVGIDEVFLPNQWLIERGELATTDSPKRRTLERFGLTRERLKAAVDRLGLVGLAQAVIPESVESLFPSESGRVAIQHAAIDWDRTCAVSLGRGPVYLNHDRFDDDRALAAYRDELREALEALETPAGDDVVAAVHDPVTLYSATEGSAPDLVVEYAEGIDAPESIGSDTFGTNTEWLATHRRTGVFGALGAGVGAGSAALSIYDVAPTLLHLLGEPVPEDVDGSVRRDVLDDDGAAREVESGPPTAVSPGGREAGEEIEATLRELGYLE